MTKESCPAWGKLCSKCNGRNHFAIVCQNKGRVHVVNAERQDDNAYELLNGVTTVNNVKPEKAEYPSKPLIFAEMCIDGKRIKFQVDSGASVNLIPACHIGEAELSRPTKVLQVWDKSLKTPLGECRVKMINPANNKKYAVLFTVVDEDLMPVLGASASQQMGLITVNRANIRQVTATNREADILEKYKDVFNDDVGHSTQQSALGSRRNGQAGDHSSAENTFRAKAAFERRTRPTNRERRDRTRKAPTPGRHSVPSVSTSDRRSPRRLRTRPRIAVHGNDRFETRSDPSSNRSR